MRCAVSLDSGSLTISGLLEVNVCSEIVGEGQRAEKEEGAKPEEKR